MDTPPRPPTTRLPGTRLAFAGLVIDAGYVAIHWGPAASVLGLDDGSAVVGVLRVVLAASLVVVAGGAVAVAAGYPERGGLVVALGSVPLLAPGVVSLYGGLRVRTAAARQRVVPAGEEPVFPLTLTKAAGRSQAVGMALVVIGLVLAVVGGAGGILLSVGLLGLAAGRYEERNPALAFYADRLVWAPRLGRRPVAIRYADVLDVQEEDKAVLVVARGRTVRVPSDAVEPRAYADLAGRLLALRPAPRSGGGAA